MHVWEVVFGLASNDLHTHETAGPSQCKETPKTASALRVTTWTISLRTKPQESKRALSFQFDTKCHN